MARVSCELFLHIKAFDVEMIFEHVLISLVNPFEALFLNGAEEVFVRGNRTIKGI